MMMKEIKSPFLRTIYEYGLITVSIWIMVVGIYFFKFPNHFAFGGITGFSTVVSQLTHWSASDFTSVTNTALLLFGFLFLGKGFGLKTVYATMVMSVSLSLLERFCPLSAPLTSQPLLDLMFAIFLPAVGTAILFNIGASSGGTDIIAMILSKYTSLEIGKALLVSDFCIALFAGGLYGVRTGLYCVLGLLAKAFVVDGVIEGINVRKKVTIVSRQPDKINEFIMGTLHRGATVYTAHGAFSGRDEQVITTVLNRREAVSLRNYIRRTDPGAFITIVNSSETIGKGFRAI